MSTPTWPLSLPSPRVEFTGALTHSVIRTQMESGRIRQRRRFMARQMEWKFELLFTEVEMATFEEFLDVTLAGGAKYFNMEIIGSSGVMNRVVRVVGGEYSFRQVPPDRWEVSLNVEDSYKTLVPSANVTMTGQTVSLGGEEVTMEIPP